MHFVSFVVVVWIEGMLGGILTRVFLLLGCRVQHDAVRDHHVEHGGQEEEDGEEEEEEGEAGLVVLLELRFHFVLMVVLLGSIENCVCFGVFRWKSKSEVFE